MPRISELGAPPILTIAPARTNSGTNVGGVAVVEIDLGAFRSGRSTVDVGPRRTALVELHDQLYDDLLSEATLAILEGRDPAEAVRSYGARERSFGRVTCPLFDVA